MNEDQSQQQNPTSPPQPGYTSPPQPPLVPQMPPRNQLPENLSTIKQVEKITVWVMVISAILFAGVSVLAIWGVFSDASGDIVGKSLGTLAVIAFAALIVNIGANMLEGKKK